MKAVVLTFARLPLSMLGCYGNLRVRTPQFDRLAAESVVFDHHFAENVAPEWCDSPNRTSTTRSVVPLSGAHAWATGCFQFPTAPETRRGGLEFGAALGNAGVTTRLVTEAGEEPFPLPEFDGRDLVRGFDGLDVPPYETPFARLVESGLESLAELQASGADRWLLWLHSRGVPCPWLPPREYAMMYVEAEDAGTESPSEIDKALTAAARPDAAEDQLPISRAIYAGYVTLLDEWLGRLLDGLESALAAETHLLILTSAAGEALGNRARLPDLSAPLRDEIVHTPLIARLTDCASGERESGFVQPMDVPATLLGFFGSPVGELLDGRSFLPVLRGEHWTGREAAYLGIGRQLCGVRTSRYSLVRADDPPEERLYLKPEDVWDALDVAGQWPQFVEEGSALLDRLLGRGERLV